MLRVPHELNLSEDKLKLMMRKQVKICRNFYRKSSCFSLCSPTRAARIFHQSSHLGDEFLLRGETDKRVNLSYESVHNLFSYPLPVGFRIYAGRGYLLRRSPSDLDPWSTQAGLKFRSPKTWFGGTLRPVAAADVQHRQESDWNTDISVRTGIQFENPDFLSRKFQLLLEYYKGKSPNGQFYENSIEFFGIGVHLFF